MASVALPVAPSVVNAPDEGVVPPIAVLLMEPPVIATALAFWVDIVPNPVMAVFGMVVDAVMADVPFPYTYPVSVAAPVPPCATANCPDVT